MFNRFQKDHVAPFHTRSLIPHNTLILTLSRHMESYTNNKASLSSSQLHPLHLAHFHRCLVGLEWFSVVSWVARHLGKLMGDWWQLLIQELIYVFHFLSSLHSAYFVLLLFGLLIQLTGLSAILWHRNINMPQISTTQYTFLEQRQVTYSWRTSRSTHSLSRIWFLFLTLSQYYRFSCIHSGSSWNNDPF